MNAPLRLFVLIVVSALLRLQGVDWDQGQHLHPDERFLTMVAGDVRAPDSIAEYFDTASSPLNPVTAGHRFFVYGTLPLFLIKGVGATIGWTGYDRIHLVGRVCSALADVGTVVLTYRLALLLAGSSAALVAAALMTFSVMSIQQAHFFTVDSLAVFFSTASLLALARVALGGGLSAHLLFGGAFALALACRFNLLLLGLLYPIAVGHAWRQRGTRGRDLLGAGALTFGLAAAVFRVAQPYAFAGPGFVSFTLAPSFLESLNTIGGYVTGAVDYPPSVQWVGRLPVLFSGRNLLIWGLGPAWGLAAVAAVPWCFGRRTAEAGSARLGAARVVLLCIPLVFLFHATQFAATIRYFLPIVPLLALAVAWWLTSLAARNRLRHAAPVVVVLTALWAMAFTSIYRRPHTRVEASQWIYENVRPGSTIATEHWDDALPLAVGDRRPGAYVRQELRLYDEEDGRKRAHVIAALDAADIIVVSSNRLYGSIPRAPWRYPLGRRYYELLFGEALGFRVERVFASYPALAGLEIPDDRAEEAFTVYDHPKVLIFRKTPQYASERVAALLGAVSLESVVRVPPREASELYRRARPSEIALSRERALQAADGKGEPGSLEALVRWLLAFELLSVSCFGLLFRPFAHAVDSGYGLAKLAAWLGPGTLVWLLASTGLAANGATTARSVAAVLIALGAVTIWRRRHEFRRVGVERWRTIAGVEAVFLGGFTLFLVIRAFNPAIFWGEKPMDFAILNASLRAMSMPPADPWFAGEPLNYFYFGHVLTAVFAQLSGAPAAIAFNLALATIGAMLAAAVCSLVLQVTGRVAASVGAAVLVVVIGNLAGLRAFTAETTPRIGFDYFWAVSRVVPGTINEFPLWNLTFGDLHAHVLAMPLTAALLNLGALWLPAGVRVGTLPLAAMSAWFLGAVAVTSSWTLPTATALQLGFVMTGWLHGPRTFRGLARAVIIWIGIVAGAYVLFWPFWSRYVAPPLSWGWVAAESASVWEVTTVFGVFLALAFPALASSISSWVGTRTWRIAVPALFLAAAIGLGSLRSSACGFLAGWTVVGLLVWLTDPRPVVRTGSLLVASAGALGVFTELVFIWDRMNTVFKYYLEMWLMLGAGAALLAWSAWQHTARAWRGVLAGVCGGVVAAGLFTSVTALAGFLSEPRVVSTVPTLNGMQYLRTNSAGELDALRWINSEIAGIPVMLEAHGPSYQAFTRVAMNTGLPTVLGWDYHLFQQGRPRVQIDARAADVRDIYESTDLAHSEQLLRRYHVDFVFVGPLERRTYPAAGLAKFQQSTLLQPVFRNPDVIIYATEGRARSVKTWIDTVPPASPVLPFSSPLREPRAVAAAADGTLAVADFGNRRVQRLQRDLRPVAAFGREGAGLAEFRDPCGVAFGADGTIWVADTWNHRIQRFTPGGQPLSEWYADLYGPRGIAVAADGVVYVTDTGHRRVVRFDPNGQPRELVGQTILDNPVGIALGAGGEIFVADVGHRRVAVFDATGRLIREWPIEGWRPGPRMEPYLAVGPDGVVWVTDPSGRRVLLFDREGRALGVGQADTPLELPLGIAVIDVDTAVVTDAATGRIVEVRRQAQRLQTPTRNSPAR